MYMYHHIGTGVVHGTGFTPNRYYVSPTEVDRQMHYVAYLASHKKIHVSTLAKLQYYQDCGCFPYRHLVIFTVDDGRADTYFSLYPIIQKYRIPFEYAIIANTLERTGANNPYLTTAEITEMLASGLVHIQSHSLDHADFAKLSSGQMESEICDSKQKLELDFGVTINSFVYPYGHFTEDNFAVLRQCGYYYGISTTNASMTKKNLKKDRYRLFRREVDPGMK